MVKKSPVEEIVIVIRDGQRTDYKRMDLAAEKYGVTVSTIKAFINSGKLKRFKLSAMTLIDCSELEKLIVPDVGNHGPAAAPGAAKN
jgi:hypothetical protein